MRDPKSVLENIKKIAEEALSKEANSADLVELAVKHIGEAVGEALRGNTELYSDNLEIASGSLCAASSKGIEVPDETEDDDEFYDDLFEHDNDEEENA